jgi:hypothetical protein
MSSVQNATKRTSSGENLTIGRRKEVDSLFSIILLNTRCCLFFYCKYLLLFFQVNLYCTWIHAEIPETNQHKLAVSLRISWMKDLIHKFIDKSKAVGNITHKPKAVWRASDKSKAGGDTKSHSNAAGDTKVNSKLLETLRSTQMLLEALRKTQMLLEALRATQMLLETLTATQTLLETLRASQMLWLCQGQ